MRMHKSITFDRLMDAANRQQCSLDDPGFCIACGIEQEGHEPDAENHECESCGKHRVFGAAQLLILTGALLIAPNQPAKKGGTK